MVSLASLHEEELVVLRRLRLKIGPRFLSLVTMIATLLSIASLAILGFLSSRPRELGLVDGSLRPCPETPNCVSTQGKDPEHTIESIRFEGAATDAMSQLRQLLESRPRTKVISVEGDYLHAEARSLIFRFVDDLEFLVDGEAGVIDFRFASRVGHSDLGVNRKRAEGIRAAFARMVKR